MRGMIVAPQPDAVEEGAKILLAGGNALDAAVTCAFVQWIIDPQMCGLGGYMVLHLATPPYTAPVLLDAPALAGSKVSADMWESKMGAPNPDGWGYFLEGQVNDVGYQSICTPSVAQGLAAALERWGTMSWQQALEPAIRIAEEGFVVSAQLAASWKQRATWQQKPPTLHSVSLLERLQTNPEARRVFLKSDGSAYDVGERFGNPDYARTLRRLAAAGVEDFYHGELATRMSTDLSANGSFVTPEDLAEPRLREGAPLAGTYNGYTVATSPPPHGGPTLLEIMNILEPYDLAALGHNSPAYIYLVSMAMKAAFAERNRILGDPKFVPVPLQWMISKERAAQWRKVIDARRAIDVSRTPPGPPHTTHVTAVDKDGNCVALTHSLGYSSGVVTPGLGFIYNNSMVNFHPFPGHPNSIAPQKGRTTGIAPTIVYKNGRPVLVLGAPGATWIITSTVQVLVNVLNFGMTLQEAVLAPRFDCQGDVISCQARIPEYVCREVRKLYPIERLPQSHGGMGLMHGIAIDPRNGQRSGGADAGAEGMALEV